MLNSACHQQAELHKVQKGTGRDPQKNFKSYRDVHSCTVKSVRNFIIPFDFMWKMLSH